MQAKILRNLIYHFPTIALDERLKPLTAFFFEFHTESAYFFQEVVAVENYQWRLFLSVAFAVVTALLLSGCAGLQVQNDEEQLMERANAYWQARALRDAHTIFALESAAEPRGKLSPLGAARIGQGVALSNVKVTDPKIDGDTAEVTVSADVRYSVMVRLGSKVFQQQVRDFWVKIDGDWYHKTHRVRSLGALKKEREERTAREKQRAGNPEGQEAAESKGEQ